jgi:hypothetical protein
MGVNVVVGLVGLGEDADVFGLDARVNDLALGLAAGLPEGKDVGDVPRSALTFHRAPTAKCTEPVQHAPCDRFEDAFGENGMIPIQASDMIGDCNGMANWRPFVEVPADRGEP